MLPELSLHILDIAQNAVRAGASRVELGVEEADGRLTVTIRDNGCGMSPETAARARDPFFTTKPGMRTGLGLPLFEMAAELTGGSMALSSREGEGTEVCAVFDTRHIDCMPMGGLEETVWALALAVPELCFVHTKQGRTARMDTRQFREILDGVGLDDPEVKRYVRAYLADMTRELEEDSSDHTQNHNERFGYSMKSLEELRAIKAAAQSRIGIRNDDAATVTVVVGMGTAGIAAGARPVLNALTEAVAKNGLNTVAITQSAALGTGDCQPVVEVTVHGADKVTYVNVTPEKAARIVDEHIVGGNVVAEYTACACTK